MNHRISQITKAFYIALASISHYYNASWRFHGYKDTSLIPGHGSGSIIVSSFCRAYKNRQRKRKQKKPIRDFGNERERHRRGDATVFSGIADTPAYNRCSRQGARVARRFVGTEIRLPFGPRGALVTPECENRVTDYMPWRRWTDSRRTFTGMNEDESDPLAGFRLSLTGVESLVYRPKTKWPWPSVVTEAEESHSSSVSACSFSRPATEKRGIRRTARGSASAFRTTASSGPSAWDDVSTASTQASTGLFRLSTSPTTS